MEEFFEKQKTLCHRRHRGTIECSSINVLGRNYDLRHLLSSVQLTINLSYLIIEKIAESTILLLN